MPRRTPSPLPFDELAFLALSLSASTRSRTSHLRRILPAVRGGRRLSCCDQPEEGLCPAVSPVATLKQCSTPSELAAR
jgi:hypothetical protein